MTISSGAKTLYNDDFEKLELSLYPNRGKYFYANINRTKVDWVTSKEAVELFKDNKEVLTKILKNEIKSI